MPVEGVFVFSSAEVDETLELRAGGDFVQTIKMGGDVFNSTGRWTLNAHDLKFRNHFLVRFDTARGRLLKPPQKYSLYSGYWDPSHGRISLDADYDAQYYLKKK